MSASTSRRALQVLFCALWLVSHPAERMTAATSPVNSTSLRTSDPDAGFVAIPTVPGPVQFRLYTSASKDSPRLFNTFDIEAGGVSLIQTMDPAALKSGFYAEGPHDAMHNILIDGRGPTLAPSHGMKLIGRATGPGWEYVSLDASAAYRGLVEQLTRSILFVEPDLFILHDQFVASSPVGFAMVLHAPEGTRVDADWGDLRLETTLNNLRINTPGTKKSFRAWKKVESEIDHLFPGTVTMRLEAPAKLTRVGVTTVFAVSPASQKRDYAFKLLESTSSVGARIHRDGLPTLVAFRTIPEGQPASLTGFHFDGPVGIDVFRPKQKPR